MFFLAREDFFFLLAKVVAPLWVLSLTLPVSLCLMSCLLTFQLKSCLLTFQLKSCLLTVQLKSCLLTVQLESCLLTFQLKSCLLTFQLKRKHASIVTVAEKNVEETGVVLNPLADALAKFHRVGSCWPGFELPESVLCMETVSGRYEGLSSQNCDSRLVDFRGVRAITRAPRCLTVVCRTASVSKLLYTGLLMELRCEIFLTRNSRRNCLWTRATGFVALK